MMPNNRPAGAHAMTEKDWVEVKQFIGAYEDAFADLCVAELNAAGIEAVRIPPTAIGALMPARITIKIIVPPAMEEVARAVLAEDPWIEAACFEGLNAEDQAERLMAGLKALKIEFIRFPYEPELDPLRTDKVRILVPGENLDEAKGIAKRIH